MSKTNNRYLSAYNHHMRKSRRINKRKLALFIVLGVLLALFAVGGIFIMQVMNPSGNFSNEAKPDDLYALPAQETAGNAGTEPSQDPYELILQQANKEFMKDTANILILGIDRSKSRESLGSFRTDTMIVLHCDFKQNSMSMISLPRDSLVYIYPFKHMARINTAFGDGGGEDQSGYEYAMKTAARQLCVPINYFVGFDMTVVKKIVDTIGGVDYYVDIDVEVDGRTVPRGQQHLDGQQVLDYCRMRKGSSDIERTKRQRQMLFTIIEQMKAKDLAQNLPGLYTAMQENIRTNLDLTQICSLAIFAKDLDLSSIQSDHLPGNFLDINETSYWGIIQSEKEDFIRKYFGDIEVSTDKREDFYRLRDLAVKNEELRSEARSRISNARSYFDANGEHVKPAEKTKLNDYISALQALMNEDSVTTLGDTVDDLSYKVRKFKEWLADIKEKVEQRKAEAAQPSESPPESSPPESSPPTVFLSSS